MFLKELFEGIEHKILKGSEDVQFNKIEHDSKKIEEGDIFVAITGYEEDGNKYIPEAISKGAKVVVVEENSELGSELDVTYVTVPNIRIALAEIAAVYYGHPADELKIIGITGTKGKTTTAYMIRDMMLNAGKPIGMIGGVNITYGNNKFDASRSCPESLNLHKIFRNMVDAGMEYVVMEVTSHALELHRVHGIKFAIGVYTNLSQDHLDFHKTMDNYFNTKMKLFDQSEYALVNSDDIYAPKVLKLLKCPHATYGLDNSSNLTAVDIKINSKYVEFKMFINKMLQKFIVNIPGRYSVYNSLAAIGVVSTFGVQIDSIEKALLEVKVPGRSEIVDIDKTFTVMIDFAHTPNSLESVIQAAKKYCRGRVICVFGCGGDRDTAKRPMMGEISGRLADFTIITTDNPRSENAAKIMKEIEAGVNKTKGIYKVIENRKEAIKFAMQIAWRNDIVILAGKGHETSQELRNKTIHFDERDIVKQIASEMEDKNTNQY
ncbi:MAG: UDP-N-acetylmuramoyl-L-alanyl-D-glutamate--2,6-diaminopimelate ligase [Clostridia bacterium]